MLHHDLMAVGITVVGFTGLVVHSKVMSLALVVVNHRISSRTLRAVSDVP